jgi:hypothetical protein
MKTWLIVAAIAAVVVAGALGAIYYTAGTPQYSLYLIRNAVRDGDRATFYSHFDVKKVVSNAIQRELGGILPAGPNIVSDKATDMLIPASERLIRERLDERLAEPDKVQQLSMSISEVSYSGNAAFVTLASPEDGSTTMLMLERMPNRHWKIVDVDLERANIKYSLQEAREVGEELLGPQLPDKFRPPTF